MIRYTQGNLLDAPAEALVNTVNEIGVMGKGIALLFREAFPESSREYERAAKAGEIHVGHVMLTRGQSLIGPRWIIHFPTKKHWRQPSRLEWVRDGLKDLVRVIQQEDIRSVALPPLGCGNGGLEWLHVRREIEGALATLTDVDVTVFEPTERYYNAPKRAGVEELTPARALIAELVRRYSVLGIECSALEVQKLTWFLGRAVKRQHLGDPLKLEFSANRYGPYADRLRHLIDALDGSYLHSEKRLADAKPADAVWFDDAKQQIVAAYLISDESRAYLPALDEVTAVIDGFESPLGLEALATVDWLLHVSRVEPNVSAIRAALEKWPAGRPAAQRKQRIFSDRLLQLSIERLVTVLPEAQAGAMPPQVTGG
ncbi:macro domain-containing protein [soil metagenome]